MEINLAKLNWSDWLLAVVFLTLFIFLLMKGTLSMFNNLQTRNTPNSKRTSSLRNVIWLYGSGLSLIIALGILIGLPIENLRCWLLLIPFQCFLLPWIAFNIWGINIQLGWRDMYEDLFDKIKTKKGK